MNRYKHKALEEISPLLAVIFVTFLFLYFFACIYLISFSNSDNIALLYFLFTVFYVSLVVYLSKFSIVYIRDKEIVLRTTFRRNIVITFSELLSSHFMLPFINILVVRTNNSVYFIQIKATYFMSNMYLRSRSEVNDQIKKIFEDLSNLK